MCNRCSQISVYIVLQDMGIGSNSVCKGDVHRFLCIFCLRILVFGHTQCVREMFTDFCIYCVSGYWHRVILSSVHKFLHILCLRILVLGHTQCVREMFTVICV